MQTIERSYTLRNPIEAAAIVGLRTPAFYATAVCLSLLIGWAHASAKTAPVLIALAVVAIVFAYTTSVVMRMSKMRAVYTIKEMRAEAPPHIAVTLLHLLDQCQTRSKTTVVVPKAEMEEVLTYIQNLRQIAGMKDALRKGQADDHTQVISAPK